MDRRYFNEQMRVSLLAFSAALFLLSGCARQDPSVIAGFWYGPHPEDDNAKFVIRLYCEDDTLKSAGFWLAEGHYNAEFGVHNPVQKSGEISFAIPIWGCRYNGQLSGDDMIKGCFHCEGEDPDSVDLTKDDRLGDLLVYPKPCCKEPGYQYKYSAPEGFVDDLKSSAYQHSGDSLFIHNLMNELLEGEYGRYNSFLVARENRLICEEYFYGYHAEELHPIESVTKSVTSLLVGLAIEQGKIRDVNTPLYKLLPGFPHLEEGNYKNLTLYHLLTMTAGFQMNEEERMSSDDRIGYALRRELIHPPGEMFRYDGGSTEILAAVIKEATGMHADEFAAMHLFGPLGINDYKWDAHRQNGYPLTSGSLTMRPGDMIKIGLMVLNDGMWNGNQVVSSEWIRESTSAHTESHIPGDHYGYQWWRITIISGGKDYETIWANGWGSQFIFILPEPDMVIVTTGYNYEDERSWDIFEGLKKHLYLVDETVICDP